MILYMKALPSFNMSETARSKTLQHIPQDLNLQALFWWDSIMTSKLQIALHICRETHQREREREKVREIHPKQQPSCEVLHLLICYVCSESSQQIAHSQIDNCQAHVAIRIVSHANQCAANHAIQNYECDSVHAHYCLLRCNAVTRCSHKRMKELWYGSTHY
jgi:hypothetical protein